MNKKFVIAVFAVAVCAFGAQARPHGGPGGGFRRGPAPMHRVGHRPPPPIHHHHGHGVWGRGGSHFWPGFVGGVVGGAVMSSIVAPAPVVVASPTVVTTTQNVWVEGRYVDQVQPNGVVVRVWQPGHYEQRVVTY